MLLLLLWLAVADLVVVVVVVVLAILMACNWTGVKVCAVVADDFTLFIVG